MVAATYCPEPRKGPQILVSVEELRGYFRDAETELYRSKGFRTVLGGFKQKGLLNSETQALIKVICREAIRSALRQVCCPEPPPNRLDAPSVSTLPASDVERSPQPSAVNNGLGTAAPRPLNTPLNLVQPGDLAAADVAPMPLLSVEDLNLGVVLDQDTRPVEEAYEEQLQVVSTPAAMEAVVHEEIEVSDAQTISEPTGDRPDLSAINPTHWWSTLRQPKPYIPTPEELRQSQLQDIGKTLLDARLAQNMPLEALHQRTLIAKHQIRAIEAGGGKWLPEDIYLKGFIRRMGTVLGLDGQALADQLTPMPAPVSARPSWYSQSPAIAASRVDPTQLYIGYAAVVAGSVWGLSWMSQHPIDVSQIPALQSALGAQSPTLQPQMAQEGLKIAPRATVDTSGNIKIQFSNRPVRSPVAAEKAAMDTVQK